MMTMTHGKATRFTKRGGVTRAVASPLSSSSSASAPASASASAAVATAAADAAAAARWGSSIVQPNRSYAALGLGQAMVDLAARVDDKFINELGLADVRGGRKVIDAAFKSDVLAKLDDYAGVEVSAGGSLSNTLVALSRLGEANDLLQFANGEHVDVNAVVAFPSVRVGMAGSIGDDPLGGFYRREVRKAGVNFLSEPRDGAATGSVVVLTTPDAQRTMLSHPGSSADVPQDDAFFGAIQSSASLIVEGYLWEEGATVAAIANSVKRARKVGTRVVLTASDVTCVERFAPEMRELVSNACDLLFCNAAEAHALTGEACPAAAAEVAARECPLVVVTDGCHGSYVASGRSTLIHVPAHAADFKPVDTCGAGDAYAAGFLFGMLNGETPEASGLLGSICASQVVGHAGARLARGEANEVMRTFALSLQ
ncbi:pfkB family carbohydrate kinase [Pseudoscourfieldia marina]